MYLLTLLVAVLFLIRLPVVNKLKYGEHGGLGVVGSSLLCGVGRGVDVSERGKVNILTIHALYQILLILSLDSLRGR
jgi:hypothetical protein